MLLHYLGKLINHLHGHMLGYIIDTSIDSGESVSRHVPVQMVDTVCKQTPANNLYLHVFLV